MIHIYLKRNRHAPMTIRLDSGLAFTGLFLVFVGVGTMEADGNRFSMPLGMAILLIGLVSLYFSNREYRSLNRLRRKILILKQDILSLFD